MAVSLEKAKNLPGDIRRCSLCYRQYRCIKNKQLQPKQNIQYHIAKITVNTCPDWLNLAARCSPNTEYGPPILER
jgi:hypothetical protein